jgi:hypothetical protein
MVGAWLISKEKNTLDRVIVSVRIVHIFFDVHPAAPPGSRTYRRNRMKVSYHK